MLEEPNDKMYRSALLSRELRKTVQGKILINQMFAILLLNALYIATAAYQQDGPVCEVRARVQYT